MRPRHSRRSSSSAAPIVIAATALFAVVIGVLVYASRDQQPNEQANLQPKKELPAPPKNIDKPQPPKQPSVKTPVIPVANQKPLAKPELSREAKVAGYLAAGEFNLALAEAKGDSSLMKKVVDAQLSIGEYDAALFAMRGVDDDEYREAAGQAALAGGGGQADFGTLINLIQSETSAKNWEADGGEARISVGPIAGVRVDPTGVLARMAPAEQVEELKKLARGVRVADLNTDMAKTTNMRVISLTRIEQEVARRLQEGRAIPASIRYMAGLTAINYVFVDPKTKEVLIGGPAEGWRVDERGRVVGVNSGRPIMHLDDFVTVMRVFNGGKGAFTCSIEPRQQNLLKLKQFIDQSNKRGALSGPASTRRWVKNMETLLGQQNTIFDGIPADSRVARVIISADYKMKLIGIGKKKVGPNVRSYFDLLPAKQANGAISTDALRWWLTMNYSQLVHSPDKSVFQFKGPSVQVLAANEKINAAGQRVQTGKTEPTNAQFARLFTKHYDEVAKKDHAFADLENVFDLALVAALIREEQMPFSGGVFAKGGAYQPKRYDAPKSCPTVANHKVYPGGVVVAQVAGGVRADLMAVVRNDQMREASPRLGNLIKSVTPTTNRWWWDAK